MSAINSPGNISWAANNPESSMKSGTVEFEGRTYNIIVPKDIDDTVLLQKLEVMDKIFQATGDNLKSLSLAKEENAADYDQLSGKLEEAGNERNFEKVSLKQLQNEVGSDTNVSTYKTALLKLSTIASNIFHPSTESNPSLPPQHPSTPPHSASYAPIPAESASPHPASYAAIPAESAPSKTYKPGESIFPELNALSIFPELNKPLLKNSGTDTSATQMKENAAKAADAKPGVLRRAGSFLARGLGKALYGVGIASSTVVMAAANLPALALATVFKIAYFKTTFANNFLAGTVLTSPLIAASLLVRGCTSLIALAGIGLMKLGGENEKAAEWTKNVKDSLKAEYNASKLIANELTKPVRVGVASLKAIAINDKLKELKFSDPYYTEQLLEKAAESGEKIVLKEVCKAFESGLPEPEKTTFATFLKENGLSTNEKEEKFINAKFQLRTIGESAPDDFILRHKFNELDTITNTTSLIKRCNDLLEEKLEQPIKDQLEALKASLLIKK